MTGARAWCKAGIKSITAKDAKENPESRLLGFSFESFAVKMF